LETGISLLLANSSQSPPAKNPFLPICYRFLSMIFGTRSYDKNYLEMTEKGIISPSIPLPPCSP